MAGQQYQIRGDTRANVELATPAARELAVVTDKNELSIGDGSTAGGQPLQRKNRAESLAPAQIVADTNNYAPSGYDRHCGLLVLTTDAKRRLTGLTGGSTDRVLFVVNGGSQQLVLSDADAASTAANRFDLNGDLTLMPKGAIKLFYNATASRWQRTSGGAKFNTVPEDFLLTGVSTPVQITADQNDYAPNDSGTATKTFVLSTVLRLNTDASRNITGMADARDGVTKTIVNVGTNPIVLKNSSASSSAANRFDFGADITLAAKQSARIRYDATDSRWKLESSTAGSSVGAGAVTAPTLSASAMGLVGMINGTIVPSVAGSALTIALKTLAGADPSASDPVYAIFRNATAATGDYTVLTITAATSLVISSGSAMGVVANNTAFRLWVVGFNDAGTFRLGAINCLSGTDIYPLSGWGIASSTAEGGAGAADSAQVFYTGTAVASKAYFPICYMTWESGLAALSTWSAGPTRTQLFGAGVPLPGTVVGRARQATGAVATGTTTVPFDDTIPQNTEGDQYLSKAITPSSAAHVLRLRAELQLSSSVTNTFIASAFQDTAASALSSAFFFEDSAGGPRRLSLEHEFLAGTSIATTLKIRAGGSTAGTTTFNGNAAARFMGGVADSFLIIEEIAA